jgi:hypothetical protein
MQQFLERKTGVNRSNFEVYKSHAAIPGKENRSNRSNFEVYKSHAAIPGKENRS